MNSITKFFHELFQPHCPHCLEERQEDKHCESCETLKEQLSIANHERELLLQRILTPAPREADRIMAPEPQAVKPRTVPWNIRRQMLEQEDREKARILREAPQPIADLEKELGIVENARENEAGS
jgi:hypothetical protein